MNSNNKYHVTIEDCIDEYDLKQQKLQQQGRELDIDRIQTNESDMLRGSKRQAWDQIDDLEESARFENEKLLNARVL